MTDWRDVVETAKGHTLCRMWGHDWRRRVGGGYLCHRCRTWTSRPYEERT